MERRYKNLILWEISKIKWLPIIALAVMYFTSIAYKENMMLEDCRVLTEGFMNTAWSIELICTGFSAFNIGWVVLLAFCQFNDDANIWYSLPYRKKELHSAKLITGIGFITLMLAIYTVWIIALYHRYIPFMEDIYSLYPFDGKAFSEITIIENMALTWVVLIFIYLVFMFSQYMVNQPVIAAIFGIIILVTPVFIMEMAERYGGFNTSGTYRFLYFPLFPFNDTKSAVDDYIIAASWSSAKQSGTSIEWRIPQGSLFSLLRLVYYTVLSFVMVYVCNKCANSDVRAENGGLLPGKVYGKIFIAVITLFIAGFFGSQFMYSINKWVGILVFLFFGIVTFVIANAILKKQGVLLWQKK